jgi:hypothetical protein
VTASEFLFSWIFLLAPVVAAEESWTVDVGVVARGRGRGLGRRVLGLDHRPAEVKNAAMQLLAFFLLRFPDKYLHWKYLFEDPHAIER